MRLLPVVIILAFAGCASVTMYTEPYEPKPETAEIDVYNTKMPERDYIQIGEIAARHGLEQLKSKAREIGADGVIIIGTPEIEYMGYSAKGDKLKAVAIRYK